MASFIQDPTTGKLVPRNQYQRKTSDAPAVIGDIEPFVSPVDGKIVSSRTKLRNHNREHGIAAHADYGENGGEAYFERAGKERGARLDPTSPKNVADRRDDIIRVTEQHLNRKSYGR